MLEKYIDWAISSRTPNRSGFNDYPGSGSRCKRFETGRPKPRIWHGEDIVCSLWKHRDGRLASVRNTQDLTGEYGDNDFILTRGDSRISMIIARDSETIQFERDNRFLIDDYESHTPLSYRLTKPFKMGGSYNENGILSFVLAECNAEDDDNFDLHIADYYKYFPRPNNETPVLPPDDEEETTGKKVWF